MLRVVESTSGSWKQGSENSDCVKSRKFNKQLCYSFLTAEFISRWKRFYSSV